MRRFTALCRQSLALGIALPLLASPAWGQESAGHKVTLQGVTIVEVVVDMIDANAERDGLTRAHLQADVEARLRQAGISVGPTPTGHLYVNVDTEKGDDGRMYAYNVEVEYVQQVRLLRDPQALLFAPTWECGGVGLIRTDRLRDVRDDVLNYVDQFIKVYLDQNRKP